MKRISTLGPSLAFALAACGGADANDDRKQQDLAAVDPGTCEVVARSSVLPAEVRETSGLARSTRDPGRFWTHNDAGNEPVLFALDESGALTQTVRVTGATLEDWEDVEAAPCPDGGACLYIGDIGDNDGERAHVTVYRVVEPEPGVSATAPAEALHARFPDGARDAEALFVDAAGRLYLVTRGRREEVGLYRWPESPVAGSTSALERVRVLATRPGNDEDHVTAATATRDGRWIGIRTYRTLYVYAADALTSGEDVPPAMFDLSGLGEAQGEALAMADDGTVWTTSEAQSRAHRPRWSRLRCALE